MAGGFKIYDFTEVAANLVGIPIDSGFAPGTGIAIKRNPGFTFVRGADGQVTRSKTNDKTAEIRFTLLQSASANALLSALYNLDLASNNGAGVGPISIRDKQGLSLHFGAHAWIAQAPDAEYAQEATNREWVIHVADLDGFDGGN